MIRYLTAEIWDGGMAGAHKSAEKGVISYNPSYPFTRPFIWVITPFITSRGPSYRMVILCMDLQGG